jgi:tRNA nucleotidyltransferase (CCA-adding enzyme)
MKTEKSCGAVVFTRDGEDVKFVIIQSREGYYGFPKGHVENGETELETALREIREEAGLFVSIQEGFRTEDSHEFVKHEEQRLKYIVYFLAEYSDQVPIPQTEELNNIVLVDYETAMELFQFESSKRILTEAWDYLRENMAISK